jgi:hypothetical protein
MKNRASYSQPVIGKCSICGGDVRTVNNSYTVEPRMPRCDSCGAVAGHLPVIQTAPPKYNLKRAGDL